jgi:hypothetical protein
MKKAFNALQESRSISENIFRFLQVSSKWETLDTWLKNLVFPAELKGNVVILDYYTPVGRMKILYNKQDVLTEIRRFLPFVEDVRPGKPRNIVGGAERKSSPQGSLSQLLTPYSGQVSTEGIKDKELAELFEKYVRIRRAWQEWKKA